MNGIKINEKQKQLYIEKGYWSKKTLLDYWNESVKKFSQREFIVDDDGNRFTYKEVDEKSSKIAAYFKEINIHESDVVSYQLPPWSEFIFISIACIKVGAIANPIGLCYKERELTYLLNLSKSKLFICPTFFHKTNYEKMILGIKENIKSLENILLIDKLEKKFSSCLTLNHILKNYEINKENAKVDSNEIALILYTSGTTGNEKGVMLTHNNILFSEIYFNKELGLTKDDIIFMPAPLNHATGYHHGIILPMLHGGKVVLQSKFSGDKAINLINKEKCTYSMGATPFIYDILKALEENKVKLSTLKFYLCGGAPLPSSMVQRAYDEGIKLCEVYGSTESVPHVFVRQNEILDFMGSSSGRPIEGVEVKVVDENGEEVSPGVIGEEISRGPNVFVGYLNDKTSTDKAINDDGWFYSGDYCIHDGKGNIKIIGRKKDMIVRGGENLNSNKINEYISGYYKIKDQATIGMPDERFGEKICSYVVLNDNEESITLEELLNYLEEENICKRYWPERLEIIDKIPKTDSGKVKKYILEDNLKYRMKDVCQEGLL